MWQLVGAPDRDNDTDRKIIGIVKLIRRPLNKSNSDLKYTFENFVLFLLFIERKN